MLTVETLAGINMVSAPKTETEYGYDFLSRENTEPVRHLHESIRQYSPTPLTELGDLAGSLGVASVCVKDESKRFGLNAFKGLGGIYAVTRAVCDKLGLDYRTATLGSLQSPENRKKISEMTFVTATDGNHGRGIAWAVGLLGARAFVYMPSGSREVRAQAIREAGNAEVIITDLSYDDAVRHAARMAEEMGWILIQDTSWPGYETVPKWIVQGYTTMVYEAVDQLELMDLSPTHVFIQAGVGAMAGCATGVLRCTYGRKSPVISIVEPSGVACIFESVRYNDGKPHKAADPGNTIMAGLNCAEPCTITWPIIRDQADFCFACADTVSALGMRILAAPVGNDRPVVSGESGAVTAGLLSMLMTRDELEPFRKRLGLNRNSVVLLFNTEGDTDPAAYRNIITGI